MSDPRAEDLRNAVAALEQRLRERCYVDLEVAEQLTRRLKALRESEKDETP